MNADAAIKAAHDWYQANAATDPRADAVAVGFAWAIAALTGLDNAAVLDRIRTAAQAAPVSPYGLDAGPPVSAVAVVPGPVPEDPIGVYPGLGVVTRAAAQPKVANLEDPVGVGRAVAVDLEGGGRVVELDASYGELAEQAKAEGHPMSLPVHEGRGSTLNRVNDFQIFAEEWARAEFLTAQGRGNGDHDTPEAEPGV